MGGMLGPLMHWPVGFLARCLSCCVAGLSVRPCCTLFCKQLDKLTVPVCRLK